LLVFNKGFSFRIVDRFAVLNKVKKGESTFALKQP
jgi:hypothetical protein